jgi:hypothetical protein
MHAAVLDGWADERDLAYLQDRCDVNAGRPQTHATVTYGDPVRLWPLAQPEEVNELRAMLNMHPLSEEEIANAWTADELTQYGRPLTEQLCRVAPDLARALPYD